MNKQSLDVVGKLVAQEIVEKPDSADVEFEEFLKEQYNKFEPFVENNSNSVINSIKEHCKDSLYNAVARVELRWRIVEQYCKVCDPFDIEPPKEATVDEILEFNDVKADAETMRENMGDEAFDNYLNFLKKPKKDGKTQTEINELREEHYAKYEPALPSEKEYNHNSGGTTRKYHWQGKIQDEFKADHENFLEHYGLSDSFPETDDDDAEESADSGEQESGNDSEESAE